LRDHAAQLGLAPDFSVVDRSDAEELLAQLRTRLDLHDSERRFPLARTCMAILSRTLNSAQPLAEVLAAHYPWCAEWQADLDRLFSAYTQAKQAQRVLDFDDLLLYWATALEDPRVAAAMGARFDHVLVDEYQDTNRLQAAHPAAAETRRARPHRGRRRRAVDLCLPRPPRWRNILDFPGALRPPATVLTLQRNYRATQPLLAAANAVIALARPSGIHQDPVDRQARRQRAPRWWHVGDEADQARWVADEVLALREEGLRLRRRRCCSARPATARRWSWSWRAGASRSSSTAACGSWRPRT
jgi:DNA helicase-2/ATP-dependent DNA helicase PcrA